MTDQQIKAASLKHEKEASFREHQEKKRSNLANEAIGRTNAAANVAKALNPFKIKLNHIEWYSHNVDSLKAVATLPYTKLQGSNNVTNFSDELTLGLGGWNIIRYVDTLPVLGENVIDASSPANLLAQSVFAHLRSKVSGSIGFESADYFMYIMAIGSTYALYSYLCNVFKLLNYEPKDSLIKSRDIITGLGLNWDSLNSHKLWFSAIINELGSIIANFALPRDFDYFKRKIWLTSNVFCEADKDTGNKYLFRPEGFMRYDNGILDFVPFGGLAGEGAAWNINQIEEYVNTFRNVMSSNGAWISMSGQTQRAYGSEIFTFPSLSTQDALSLVEDMDILNQIKGACIAPHPLTLTITQITDPDSLDYGVIYQGTSDDGLNYDKRYLQNTLLYNRSALNGIDPKYIIYSPEDEVSYEDVVRSTRLTTMYTILTGDGEGNKDWKVKYDSVGTEIVVGIDILCYKSDMYTTSSSQVIPLTIEHPVNSSRDASVLFNYKALPTVESMINVACWKYNITQIANNLKFCPKFDTYIELTSQDEKQIVVTAMPSAITHRFINLDVLTLNRINRIACNSLFGVYDNLVSTSNMKQFTSKQYKK